MNQTETNGEQAKTTVTTEVTPSTESTRDLEKARELGKYNQLSPLEKRVWFALFLAASSVLFIVFVLVRAYWPYELTEVYDYGTKSYVVLNEGKSVTAGTSINYDVYYCKNHDFPTITERYLYREGVNGGREEFPLITLRNSTPVRGCPEINHVHQYIPPNVPPGKWRMMNETQYFQPNGSKPIKSWSTDEFTVISP